MTPARKLRCAIYTRKSSEEGLEQDFNSLHAQREACAAYVQSQRQEGWKLLPKHYDDGGYSGGTLDRPALQALLADIGAGEVDLIVVYKVDRLTRSLGDFAKIVELLDAPGASFVSVTQSFNTTTSMGRLTLNVLLSFAQFEREVIGERIRDKIAASKKKGMWMGGLVPLGYDGVDRKLVVNAEEAKTVRLIFERYLALGDAAKVRRSLNEDGITSKRRFDREGRCWAGTAFSNGALFSILSNRIYRGEIAHKGQVYPGQHEAIVPQELWDAVQAVRERNRRNNTTTVRAQAKSPLLGLITDESGRTFQAVHTSKKGRRYRYYVSKATGNVETTSSCVRLPAEELERRVADRLHEFLGSPEALSAALIESDDPIAARKQLLARGKALAVPTSEAQDLLRELRSILRSVVIKEASIDVALDRNGMRTRLLGDLGRENESGAESTGPIVLTIASRLFRTGHHLCMVIADEADSMISGRRDAALIRLVAKGRRWYEQITSGEMPSLRAIAKAEGVRETYVSRVFAGALLAPDIVEAVLAGRQPVTFTVQSLNTSPPLDWVVQRKRFGFPVA